jgi:hypothetical protein
VKGILTLFIATHAGIRTSILSIAPRGYDFNAYGTLFYHQRKNPLIHGFGDKLKPRKFSAQSRSTSELLRTL